MNQKKAIQILLVDDEEIIHQTIGGYLKDAGHRVESQYRADAALKRIEKTEYDLAMVDIRMPEMDGLSLLSEIKKNQPILPVVMITGHANMETVIEALRSGAADFLVKPIKLLELDAVIEKSLYVRYLRYKNRHLNEIIGGIQSVYDRRSGKQVLIGLSSETQHIRTQIQQAVDAGCDTILVTGETGTGKEVVARQFHNSACSEGCPFIAVSCPALPETLFERELFGHDKGTFTDASRDKPGCLELADGGTLFLDEIADISPTTQAVLLRVIETRTFRRLGGEKEISVSLRLVAATNAPLEKCVEDGKFRKDLFYRLNMFRIHLRPLRDRRQDIIPLAEHFLSNFLISRNMSISGFTEDAIGHLMKYDYPGNARELKNIVERAAILCRSEHIQPQHLSLPKDNPLSEDLPNEAGSRGERDRIVHALENARWNRQRAAQDLGMPYSTLRYKIKTLGIL